MTPSTAVRMPEQVALNAPIDLVQLAASTLGNRDLELEVLRLFKTQSSATVARLKAEQDAFVQKDLVHTLKGSARSVGAARVADACECLESELSSSGNGTAEKLEAAVNEANRYIQSLLQG